MPEERSHGRLILLIAIGLAIVIGGAAYLIGTPSETYVLLPDHPHAADAIVKVAGESPAGKPDGPGIYYLDVGVRRATIAETWLAPLERDTQRVQAVQIVPPGANQRDVNRLDLLDIQSSKRLAALVALRALGRKVSVTGGGVRINEVIQGSPADADGLAPGMVVTSLDGKPIRSLAALRAALANRKVGQSVTIGVLDGSTRRTITTQLTSDPAAPGRALLGVTNPSDVAPTVKLPIKVTIDTGNLGGPSAGLAFALEIYDSLTGRRLSRDRHVAVTGTIDQHGDVGLVGGVMGKTIGARRSGFELMLVPMAEAKTARANAGSHLRVVGVRTFADALRALRKK
jgi:PDZ domain-containing protein